MPVYVPGARTDATTTGFPWSGLPQTEPFADRAAVQAEIDRHQPTIALLTQVRAVMGTEVESAVAGASLLATIKARGLDLVANLAPSPLPAPLTDLGVFDLARGLAAWVACLRWMEGKITLPVPVPAGTPGAVPVDGPDGQPLDGVYLLTELVPLDVFRQLRSVPAL